MSRNFKINVILAAAMSALAGTASAQWSNATGADSNIYGTSVANVYIQANNDQANPTTPSSTPFTGEGVFISSNNNGTTGGAGYIQLRTGGGAQVWGYSQAVLQTQGAGFSVVNTVNGGSASTAQMYSSGNAYINAGGTYGNVFIGNTTSDNTITGANNSMTATGTNTISGATNNITGVTNINVSANNATNINTGTSTAAVTVGNSANTTNLNSAINNIGVNAYATTNNMGTGSAASVNNIGNSQTASQVNAQAGNAKMTLLNNSASMTVPSSAAGVNNGFAATPTNSTMTGGNTSPTRLTMNDNAATFGRVSNGAPITVTGVADGRNDFDAVNVRQYAGAIAAVAAQANVPSLAAGQDRTIGLGLGNFMGKTGMALGMNLRDQDVVYKLSLSSSLNGGAQTVFAGGAAWSF